MNYSFVLADKQALFFPRNLGNAETVSVKPLWDWALCASKPPMLGMKGHNMTMSPFSLTSALPCSQKSHHLPYKPPSTLKPSFLKYVHMTIQVQKCLISILYPQYPDRDQVLFLNDDNDDGVDCMGSSCWESCYCKAEKFTITNPTLSASTH